MVVGREEEEEKKKKRKRKSNGKGSSEDIGESNKRFKLSHHDDAARARLIIGRSGSRAVAKLLLTTQISKWTRNYHSHRCQFSGVPED